MMNKDLYSEYTKNSHKSISKMNMPFCLNEQRTQTYISQKKEYKQPKTFDGGSGVIKTKSVN